MNDTTAVAKKETPLGSGAEMPTEQGGRTDATLLPRVDVIEDGTGITLRADLPGVPKDKLRLQVEGDTLTIEGELSITTPEGMEANHAEVSALRYRRMFTLSKELDHSKVSAEFRNGVLNLRIPKAEHAQPRRINITVS